MNKQSSNPSNKKATAVSDLPEDVWALILAYAEADESERQSCAGALRCASLRMNQLLTSHAYYYAANNMLREQYLRRKGIWHRY